MLKILNFRQLAKGVKNREGKKIKPKTIFRSGAVAYATKIDIARLKSYGIRNIYDFRSQKEINMMPMLDNNHFATHHFDILEEAANSDTKSYLKKTRDELNSKVTKMYTDEFGTTDSYSGAVTKIVMQENPEFLFHCTAGKDRTGIFGAILMMALDFDLPSIKAEYIDIDKRSMKILGNRLLEKAGVSPKDIDISKFDGVMGVLPQFIDAYFDAIFSNHGDINSYLYEKVGITPETKETLKQRYLV
jgi:protein-tyrosine phosphatase